MWYTRRPRWSAKSSPLATYRYAEARGRIDRGPCEPGVHKNRAGPVAVLQQAIGLKGEIDEWLARKTLSLRRRVATLGRPQTNGRIERANPLVLEGARELLTHAGWDKRWWSRAMRHFCIAYNYSKCTDSRKQQSMVLAAAAKYKQIAELLDREGPSLFSQATKAECFLKGGGGRCRCCTSDHRHAKPGMFTRVVAASKCQAWSQRVLAMITVGKPPRVPGTLNFGFATTISPASANLHQHQAKSRCRRRGDAASWPGLDEHVCQTCA